VLDQLRVALSAPAKISISRGANISNSNNRNLECHRLVQRLLVKSFNQPGGKHNKPHRAAGNNAIQSRR